MDDGTQDIKEYLEKLPPVVRNIVLGNEWHKRVGEIAQKYSLHIDQSSSLEYEVLFVILGMEPEEDLAANLEKELRVSKILAGQITEEVNTRIFQYIVKTMQEKTVAKPIPFEKVTDTSSQSPVKPKSIQENIPTPNYSAPIRTPQPSLELLSEIEEMAKEPPFENAHVKIVPPPANLPGMEDNGSLQQVVGTKEDAIQNTEVPNIPVPKSQITNPVSSFAGAKLGGIVTSEQDKTIQKEPSTVKTYTADPYREPIE